jgi:Fe-S oxidoreductase
MDPLRPHLEAGIPIVVLEPSCLAVFHDELINLYPDDEDAKRLSKQSFLLAELLNAMPHYTPPRLPADILLHGHCHHKALASFEDEQGLLARTGAHVEALDSGCCGMAGSFGFEANHYDVSMAVGELALLPAVRKAPVGTLIVADGFSCREQIAQGTTRRAVHLAEALRDALHPRRSSERALTEKRGPRELVAASLFGIGVALGLFAVRRMRHV